MCIRDRLDTSRRIVQCTAAGDRLPVPWAPSRSNGTREDGNGNPGGRPWTAWTETETAWMAAENPWAREESIEIATGIETGNGSAANRPITSNRPITARPYARASRTNDGAAVAPGGRRTRTASFPPSPPRVAPRREGLIRGDPSRHPRPSTSRDDRLQGPSRPTHGTATGTETASTAHRSAHPGSFVSRPRRPVPPSSTTSRVHTPPALQPRRRRPEVRARRRAGGAADSVARRRPRARARGARASRGPSRRRRRLERSCPTPMTRTRPSPRIKREDQKFPPRFNNSTTRPILPRCPGDRRRPARRSDGTWTRARRRPIGRTRRMRGEGGGGQG